MALFYDCWKSRDDTLKRHQLLREDAEVYAEREHRAAADIQRLFRGQHVRAGLTKLTNAQLLIARVFRGHRGRQKCQKRRAEVERARQETVVNYFAAVIQKLVRGVQSRTNVLDFRKRKAYIQEVIAKGDEIRRTLEENLCKQQEEERQANEKQARNELVKITQDLHHLVSTRTIAGIYNAPMSKIATSFGVAVEAHIKDNARRVVTTRLETTKAPIRLRPHPPTNKATVQATAPYDAVQQETRKQAKCQKLKRISPVDFTAVYNPHRDTERKRNTPGINAGVDYLDEWRNPYKKRGIPRTKRDLVPHLSTLGRSGEKQPFYLTYGGNKSKVLANDRFDV